MAGSEKSSGFWRFTDGLASLIKDAATDIHAAYSGVFFGDGKMAQPYLTSRDGQEQVAGFSDVMGGTVDQIRSIGHGVHGRLKTMREEIASHGQHIHSRLDHMRQELSGRTHEPGHEQNKGHGQEP